MGKITFHPAESTAQSMNRLGSEGIPFIFAFNFGLNESFVINLDEAGNYGIQYEINHPAHNSRMIENRIPFRFIATPPTFETYQNAFNTVKYHLDKGNTYLTNLTFQSSIETNLTLEEIFRRSKARYKLLISDHFVVFSPETFVTIQQNTIFSYPMKGTISAEIPDAELKIMEDPKELAEHFTIVDLIRNDLNMVSKNVKVNRFRYIDKISTHKGDLLQVSSEISGHLPVNWQSQVGSILLTMLPAGSISGAPKTKTIEIIRQAETYNRGFYTGVFGVFDGKNLQSAVMIRFIEKSGKNFFFKSGGGITIHSEVESEYRELIQKIYVPIV